MAETAKAQVLRSSAVFRLVGALVRGLISAPLVLLIAWGVCLGAWLASVATAALVVMVWVGRAAWHHAISVALVGFVLTVGAAETLWCVDAIGADSRAGELSTRQQAAVYGFNVVFGSSAVVLGFPHFGMETLVLGVPFSPDGRCPVDRLSSYGGHLPRAHPGFEPWLWSWDSPFPMRSEEVRRVARGWAKGLPGSASEGASRTLGPKGPFSWPSSAFFAEDAANGVPVALSAPTTTLEGTAVWEGDGWRLDLVMHLAVAYPERATLQVGPFALEEGMWHDSRALMPPYCGEYRWSVRADDPELDRVGPDRRPVERASTWLLRTAGAAYR